MNIKMPSFMKGDDSFSREKLVAGMVRVLADRDSGYLRELLFSCAEFFGECELSVICNDDRTILATTAASECFSEITNVAMRLKDTGKKYHYLRNEKNGLYFRKGFNCIRVHPLRERGSKTYFLMVEQEKSVNPELDRAMDVLSLAVEIYSLEQDIMIASKKDSLTGAKNRDALIDKLNETKPENAENYLGMFYIGNAIGLNEKEGMTRVNAILQGMCATISKYFPKYVYRVSGTKFCVWQKGNLYSMVPRLQDCLEELVELYPSVEFGCVASPGTEEVYKALYLCEKFGEKGGRDTVIVVREPEADFVEEEVIPYYLGYVQDDVPSEESDVCEEIVYEKSQDPTSESQDVRDSAQRKNCNTDGDADAPQNMSDDEEETPDFFCFGNDDEFSKMDVCEDL